MSDFVDWNSVGIWPLQHHDRAYDVPARRRMAAGRISAQDGNNFTPGAGTYGDVVGGLLWKETGGARQFLHAWFLTGAGAIASSGGAGPSEPADPSKTQARPGSSSNSWLPARFPSQPDDRFEAKDPQGQPAWYPSSVFPRGWTALVSACTEEYSQEEALHPDFWGLIAVNKAGDPRAGTPVFDLAPDGTPDRFARLQSIFSVLDVRSGPTIALQLGASRLDKLQGYLYCADHDNKEVGSAAHVRAGPWTLGAGKCQHAMGTDKDGNAVHPVHLSTDSLFLADFGGDAPLRFEPDPFVTVSQIPFPIWKRVHLRLNKELGHKVPETGGQGLWEWQVDVPIYIPPPIGDRWRRRRPPPPGDGDTTPWQEDGPPPFLEPGQEDGPPACVPYGSKVNGDQNKPAIALTPMALGVPSLDLKGTSTRRGDTALIGSRGPLSEEDLRLYEDAPVGGRLAGWAAGDGTWDGWDMTTRTRPTCNTPTATGGGVVLLTGDATPYSAAAGESSAQTDGATLVIPEGYAAEAFGDFDPTGTYGIGDGTLALSDGGKISWKGVAGGDLNGSLMQWDPATGALSIDGSAPEITIGGVALGGGGLGGEFDSGDESDGDVTISADTEETNPQYGNLTIDAGFALTAPAGSPLYARAVGDVQIDGTFGGLGRGPLGGAGGAGSAGVQAGASNTGTAGSQGAAGVYAGASGGAGGGGSGGVDGDTDPFPDGGAGGDGADGRDGSDPHATNGGTGGTGGVALASEGHGTSGPAGDPAATATYLDADYVEASIASLPMGAPGSGGGGGSGGSSDGAGSTGAGGAGGTPARPNGGDGTAGASAADFAGGGGGGAGGAGGAPACLDARGSVTIGATGDFLASGGDAGTGGAGGTNAGGTLGASGGGGGGGSPGGGSIARIRHGGTLTVTGTFAASAGNLPGGSNGGAGGDVGLWDGGDGRTGGAAANGHAFSVQIT